QNKLFSGNNHFFLSSSCGGFIFCSSKLIIEILLILPIALLVNSLLKNNSNRFLLSLVIGLILSLSIEFIQIFILSSVAQGISVLAKLSGFALGGLIYIKYPLLKQLFSSINFKRPILFFSLPYILILTYLSGWSFSSSAVHSNITESFTAINWLPFYYHYYTTEAVALSSLLNIFALYSPIGLAVWLWNYKTRQGSYRLIAGFLAMMLCFIVETGKLFFIDKHPDPTNLLISFSAAFIVYSLIEQIALWIHQANSKTHTKLEDGLSIPSEHHETKNSHPFGIIIGSFLILIVLYKAINYPNSPLLLMASLCLYSIVLWRYSYAWLLIIPALLPIFDFSPWTGRFFFSEFDYFILLTLAISLWRGHWKSPWNIHRTAFILLGIYVLFYMISLLLGLLPLTHLDTNTFNNYYSSYNALRVAKGLFWALLLIPLFTYQQDYIKKYFTMGLLIGLSITVLLGLLERSIFSSLFDYSSDFRISSSFYSMHTGGADLDTYLLLVMPFIYYFFVSTQHHFFKFILIPLLFSLSLYVLLMTYSRGAYIAFAISSITMMLSLFIAYRHTIMTHWKQTLWLPLFIVIIMLVSTPVLQGSFIQERFNQSFQEADFRSHHWKDAIDSMNDSMVTTLLGMGLGSFPRTYLLNHLWETSPSTFRVNQEKKNTNIINYLTLTSGKPLYIEQIIDVDPYSNYQFTMEYRSTIENSVPSILLCEKAIQHSFNCQNLVFTAKNKSSQWHHIQKNIKTTIIGDSNRPIKLVLSNQTQSTLDIKNIQLSEKIDGTDSNLIKNSDFSMGMDHWFFTADNHIPWRTENLWVQLFFDQGWIGLITFNLLLLYTLYFLFQQLHQRNNYAVALISSLSGFLVIAIIDSPFDTPNISLLFFILVSLTFISPNNHPISNKPIKKRRRRRRRKPRTEEL
ncbi:MAG: O-antigen ligase family protein, partial [Gammaproteobacteria bacterium]|nr:O-antigen ligase family protein [Gammaproteobacteria bacterium]